MAGDARPLVDLETTSLRGSRYTASLYGGGLAQLTLDPVLQKSVEEALASHHLPFAAAAVVGIPDGRVLALAGHSKTDPSLDAAALALRPWAPAASVFKVVAASALLQEGRLEPATRVCYHGGISAIRRDNLVDRRRKDRSCADLAYGIGRSQNAIIAKLTVRHLRPEQLEHIASAFGFGQDLGFDAEMDPSEADIPRDPLEFARAAAGFWHSSLSPLHGALLAATVANRGIMPAAHIVDKALDAQGRAIALPGRPARRVLDPAVAEKVGAMMHLTTTMGTARKSFRDAKGRPYLPVEVAGKTGTLFHRGRPQDPVLPSDQLSPEDGRIAYSWFVGFAPVENPTIAFAVLLGKSTTLPIKAHAVARRFLAEYLAPEDGAKPGRLLAHR
ncbi:MAG: penicillin-binding protein [Deltaproteobacteria bacterium]|nr:penicillin-binding protein [Deltaproteobacteria bacterium]